MLQQYRLVWPPGGAVITEVCVHHTFVTIAHSLTWKCGLWFSEAVEQLALPECVWS